MPKFRALEIQGFRAFCRKVELSFDGDIAVLWGPNSQGKTSLCEGIEFPLTGTTVRRELTAGSQDEFADALRNAHLPDGDEVFVQATMETDDGARRLIRRVLLSDFEKRSACTSRLEIDGRAASQEDLRDLGIVLSAPPMQAPILLQHTLAYLFSAKPGDRSAYFKALLEVADLDETRLEIQGAIGTFPVPTYELQASLDRLKQVPSVVGVLKTEFSNQPDTARVQRGLARAADALLRDDGDPFRGETTTAISDLQKLLDERQRSVFPVSSLAIPSLAESSTVSGDTSPVDALRAADSVLEKEVERFGALYSELLRVHPAEHASSALDCPACGTPAVLTAARLIELHRRLRETESYRRALTQSRNWLKQTRLNIANEASALRLLRLVPSVRERRRQGFGAQQLFTLLGEESRPAIKAWLKGIRRAGAARRHAMRAVSTLIASLPDEQNLSVASFDGFRDHVEGFLLLRVALRDGLAEGAAAVDTLKLALGKVVPDKTSTVGWKDVLDLYAEAASLSGYLQKRHAQAALRDEHERALKEFDAARNAILNAKFSGLSDEMKKWWDFLRPESLATFESVGMRSKSTRSVDFKVALYPDETQRTKELRDAIAVFSGSQLHCLGVAAFLARSVRDNGGFVVLDDPVLSSDHEHRSGFVNQVIEELVNAKLQVILVTQEQRLRDDAGVRYEHLNPDLFRIEMTVPFEGTIITKTSDGVADKLARIKTLLNGSDEATRKQAAGELRDVAERFCKEVLVRHFGPPRTLIDFDGHVLSSLIEMLDKEKLFKAPDHKGKLSLLKRWTNPGNHDAPVPATSELRSVFGDIKKLAKDYLA